MVKDWRDTYHHAVPTFLSRKPGEPIDEPRSRVLFSVRGKVRGCWDAQADLSTGVSPSEL